MTQIKERLEPESLVLRATRLHVERRPRSLDQRVQYIDVASLRTMKADLIPVIMDS